VAVYLPGARDRDEWIADLATTITAPALAASDVGVSLIDGLRVVAMSRPMRARVEHVDGAAAELDALQRLVAPANVRAITRAFARDPRPVAAVTRAVAYELPSGVTDTVQLSILRAQTHAKSAPVFVAYASPTTPTRRNESWLRTHERWVVTDADDRVLGGSNDTRHVRGLTLWALFHPEDVANSLEQWQVARAAGRTIRTERLRVIGSQSAWTHVALELRPLTGRIDRTRQPMAVATLRRAELAPVARIRDPRTSLSAREYEVFEGVIRGEHGPTIAGRLGVAGSTVRNLLARVERKLGVADRDELIERYNPRLARATGWLPRPLGFAAGHQRATRRPPRFLHAGGPRRAWVAAIARTLGSPPFVASDVAVALLDEDRIAAANPAFDRLLGRRALGMPVAEFGAPGLVADRERASDEIPGVWSFSERLTDGLLTASVVRRAAGERAVTLLYVHHAGPAPGQPTPGGSRSGGPAPAPNLGAALVDTNWRIVALAGAARCRALAARIGDLAWPFVHPESLLDTIDAFSRVASYASGIDAPPDAVADLEFTADALRSTGWGIGRNRLRAVRGGCPLVLWEGSRPFAPTTLLVDPARLAALDERDLPLALYVLDGATIARAAQLLGLAEGTVRNRLSRVYRALGVRNQRELVEQYR
jgi:DNA-binding CsgD family transcriptional regulator